MSDEQTTPLPEASPPPAPAAPPPVCGNCGKPLLGKWCYACGQPVEGLVRNFSSIVGDFLDTVFEWDARLPQTLLPLFARPGFLTREYFAGRRVRYVSPVRLFFVMSILTFFVAQMTLSFGKDAITLGDGAGNLRFANVDTVEEVIKARDQALADLAQARKDGGDQVAAVGIGLDIAEQQIRNSADARIAQLTRKGGDKPPPPKPATPAAPKPPESPPGNDNTISFNGKPWNAKTNPLRVGVLPGFANRWLNDQVGRAQNNIKRIQNDPNLLKDAVLGAVPSTLFVLLPVFALMLKLLYVFRKRLYMEHLMVALHSHAFLCLALLLVFVTKALRDWLAPGAGFWHGALGWVMGLLWAWMPIYLLIMQKRVYGQGWPMTVLKYSLLGIAYTVLLSIGAAFTVMLSLVYA